MEDLRTSINAQKGQWMASIARRPNGHRIIQFIAADKRRRTIRLGKTSQRIAEAVKTRIEHLVAASITGQAVDAETARWVTGLGGALRDKLASVGLVPAREAATLASFVDGYIETRSDVKPSTATVYGHTRRNLVQHFGSDKPLRDVTLGDADEWRLSLVKQGLADNTVRRRCGIAKQFFRVAVRRELIPSNPFDDLAAAGGTCLVVSVLRTPPLEPPQDPRRECGAVDVPRRWSRKTENSAVRL